METIQVQDLSKVHRLISNMLKRPSSAAEWEQYKLSKEQIEFYNEYGYISNIKLLDEEQIEKLKEELSEIVDPSHPGNSLFYQFASNESSDPNTVLFHALGAWRITE